MMFLMIIMKIMNKAMTRKEKITKILDKYWIRRGWIESDESMVEARPLTAKEELADAIMALPIDVPSEEEIKKEIFKRTTEPIPYTGKNYIPKPVFQFMEEISEWVKDEIIKRNRVI